MPSSPEQPQRATTSLLDSLNDRSSAMRWYDRLMQPLSLISLLISVLLLIAAVAMRGLDYRPPLWIATGLTGVAIASAVLAYVGWGNRIFRWARILLRRHRLSLKEEANDEGVDAALGRATTQGPGMVRDARIGCVSQLVGIVAVVAATAVLVATAAPAPVGVLNPLQNHGGIPGGGPAGGRLTGGVTSSGTVQVVSNVGTFQQVTPISDTGLLLDPGGEVDAAPDGSAWLTYVRNDTTAGLLHVSQSGTIATVPTPGIDSVQFFAAAHDGGLWFDGNRNFQGDWPIAHLSASGATDIYPLPVPAQGGRDDASGPVAVGTDGTLWFIADAGANNDTIGRCTPAGAITLFPIGGSVQALGSLNTLVAAPDGSAWFIGSAGQNSSLGGTELVHVHADGSMSDLAVPSDVNAMSLALAPDGSLWFTESGITSRSADVVRISAAGTVTRFVLPADVVALNAPQTPFGSSVISAAPDGSMWISAGDNVLHLTPQGTLTTYALAQGEASFSIAPDGTLWITSMKANPSGTPPSRGTLFKVTV